MLDHDKWQEFEDAAREHFDEVMAEVKRLAMADSPWEVQLSGKVTVELDGGSATKKLEMRGDLWHDDGSDDEDAPEPDPAVGAGVE